jgi:hypothetical protein
LTLVDQQAQLVNQSIAPRYNYSATIVPVVDTILPILGANQIWIKNNNDTGFIALTIQGGQVGSGTVNLGTKNELAYYADNGNAVSGVPTIPNGVVQTAFDGTPVVDTSLPLNTTGDDMVLGNPTITNGSITSVTINSSSLINSSLGTPTSGILTNCTGLPSGSGILCTNTNNNASSGQLGEYISSVILSTSAIPIIINTQTEVTHITLTAGDWDVWGNVCWPATGTQCSTLQAGINSGSPTFNDPAFRSILISGGSLFSFTSLNVTPQRFSLSTTTVIYLIAYIVNNSGSCTVCGSIQARRVR